MTKLTKLVAGTAIAAVMALATAGLTAPKANAQFFGGGANSISQWIVLSGLFGGGTFSGGGTATDNPISQWIVLGSLFGHGSIF